ncbi:DUF2971 domain-containing protein [Hymenobacter roseosalivarius]|nr:DUF2971 domain-containing protein [Hymenobacter roseosalivarius]
MNCLVGMNDTTEVNYVENYLYTANQDFTKFHWQTIDLYNRKFISSCSLKDDDLTQWRLYADDSKGACLVLTINPSIDNKSFIIKKISYGQKGGGHKELDLLRDIIIELKQKLYITFKYKNMETWKQFFKPYDYSIEEEVRILYTSQEDESNKKAWVLTSSHNILNPYIEFKLNNKDLPFTLSEIILGPKCPEKELNQRQFEHFIRELRKRKIEVDSMDKENSGINEYNIASLQVSISKINNYR